MKRDAIVRSAKSYIGTKEGSSNFNDIIHIFNTVKPDGYTAKLTDYWCAEFVSAMAIQAYGKDTAKKYFPLSASCIRIISKAKSMGIWQESDSYIPKAGDWILYDWDDSGKGNNTGSPDHVGIVEKVTDNLITVIEGNSSESVKRRNLWVNGRYIRGYVTPKYTDKKKSNTEVIKAVLSGKYGTGATRRYKLESEGYNYNSIQREVTRITNLTNAVLSGTYGNGENRKRKLGNDYNIVQWNVNRVLKEKE